MPGSGGGAPLPHIELGVPPHVGLGLGGVPPHLGPGLEAGPPPHVELGLGGVPPHLGPGLEAGPPPHVGLGLGGVPPHLGPGLDSVPLPPLVQLFFLLFKFLLFSAVVGCVFHRVSSCRETRRNLKYSRLTPTTRLF